MRIDCDECVMQHSDACDDCVVTFLLDRDDGVVVFEPDEARAIRMLQHAGLTPVSRFEPKVAGG